MLSSVSSFLRTASGSSFEWAADAVGLGPADDDGPLDSDSFGPPEEHPLWPRFFAVWGGADGAEREAALAKWRKRCGPLRPTAARGLSSHARQRRCAARVSPRAASAALPDLLARARAAARPFARRRAAAEALGR